MGEMQNASPLSAQWPVLFGLLSGVINIETSARQHGALVRRRAVRTAEALLKLCLGYGPGGMSLREAALWAGITGIATLKDTSLLYRLRKSSKWLEAILSAVLSSRLKACKDLYKGRKVRLVDATTLSRPGSKGVNWRIHSEYDLCNRAFTFFKVTDEHTAEDVRHAPIEPGEIKIEDRGYAKKNQLLQIVKAGADFIVRIGWRSLSLLGEDLKPLKLFDKLATLKAGELTELKVFIRRAKKAGGPLPLRLIIIAKSEEDAESERKKVKRRGSKKQHKTDERSFVAAGFIMILTSLDAAFPSNEVAEIYRFRWQIEIAFKRLKSILHLDALRAFDKHLALSWIYSHLILALAVDVEIQKLLASPHFDHEDNLYTPSLWRAAKVICRQFIQAITGFVFSEDLDRFLTDHRRNTLLDPPRKREKQTERIKYSLF